MLITWCSLDRFARSAGEAILLTLACVSPWAFGTVEAWARLCLDVGILLLAVLIAFVIPPRGRTTDWACFPNLALTGLLALALVQTVALPERWFAWAAPETARLWGEFAPDTLQRVSVTGEQRAVPPPTRAISQDRDATYGMATQLAAMWVLFQGALRLGEGTRPLDRFGRMTVINASCLALFSIVQSSTWQGKIYGIRPTAATNGWSVGGPFVCHGHLAAYLNIGLGFALSLVLSRGQTNLTASRSGAHGRGQVAARPWLARAAWDLRAASFLGVFLAGLIFAGVVASQSRGGALALLGAVLMLGLTVGLSRIRAGFGLLASLLLGGLFLAAGGASSPFYRLMSTLDLNAEAYLVRGEIWGATLRAWRSNPWLGTGLGSFPVATGRFYGTDRGVFFSHAENEYLQALCELGVVGFALAWGGLFAIAWLAVKAYGAAPSFRVRAFVLGGIFGGFALLLKCVADFPLHIPGVTVSAVIVAGFLCRQGLGVRRTDGECPVEPPRRRALAFALSSVLPIAVAAWACSGEFRLARAESLARGAGLPTPGTVMPSAKLARFDDTELGAMRSALERALRLRPDWAEGHLRLGTVYLSLYETSVLEMLPDGSPGDREALADPAWLHGSIRRDRGEGMADVREVIEQDPVRRFLAPAARCFLEARRCTPLAALAHAELATLDYLIEGGEPSRVHLRRALRTAGADRTVLSRVARLAFEVGEPQLAALAWRRGLEANRRDWVWVADTGGVALSPTELLRDVIPSGARLPIAFADRLYLSRWETESREMFARASLERAAGDAELTTSEARWVTGQALARLNEKARARESMEAALAAEPQRSEWRVEYASWLVAWGQPEESYQQAMLGIRLDARDADLRRIASVALEATVRERPVPYERGSPLSP